MSELLAFRGFPAGAVDCDHDWRVNPVVCATTTAADCELLMCLKCGAQTAGKPLVPFKRPFRKPGITLDSPVRWNDPATWEKAQP